MALLNKTKLAVTILSVLFYIVIEISNNTMVFVRLFVCEQRQIVLKQIA